MSAVQAGLRPLHHERPDPNLCPHCGAHGSIMELDKPVRWQPVKLGYLEDDPPYGGLPADHAPGIPVPVDYEEWHVSDDGEPDGYECRECTTSWPTAYALAAAQRLVQALADHAEFWELRADRLAELGNAGREQDEEERVAALGRAQAFRHALAILAGNGEA